MIKVPSSEARFDTSKYVCAQCWGSLAIFPDPEDRYTSILRCNTPGCPSDGMIRQTTVDRKLAEEKAAKQAAIKATREAVPWVAALDPKEKKTKEQLLKELGY